MRLADTYVCLAALLLATHQRTSKELHCARITCMALFPKNTLAHSLQAIDTAALAKHVFCVPQCPASHRPDYSKGLSRNALTPHVEASNRTSPTSCSAGITQAWCRLMCRELFSALRSQTGVHKRCICFTPAFTFFPPPFHPCLQV